MDAEEALTIGARLRQIRKTRRKSLAVIAGLAGLAGISAPTLSRIETGKQALDSISQIVGLANALQIPPSELVRLPVPAPANGHTDSARLRWQVCLRRSEAGYSDISWRLRA